MCTRAHTLQMKRKGHVNEHTTRRIDSEFESLEARFGRTLAELEQHLSAASRTSAAAATARLPVDPPAARAAAPKVWEEGHAAAEVSAQQQHRRVRPSAVRAAPRREAVRAGGDTRGGGGMCGCAIALALALAPPSPSPFPAPLSVCTCEVHWLVRAAHIGVPRKIALKLSARSRRPLHCCTAAVVHRAHGDAPAFG